MDSEEFRRARVYAAWILIAAAAFEVLIGAWTLFGLPGAPGTASTIGPRFGQAAGVPFWLRAEAAMPNLLQFAVIALPVAAVLLVVSGTRPAGATRSVTLAAIVIQLVALILGVVAWVAAFGEASHWEQASWAVEVAVALAALIVTSAILQSQGTSTQIAKPHAGRGRG